MKNTSLYPASATQPDVYDVCLAFSQAQAAAPVDRGLVFEWVRRFPQFADDLLTTDWAWYEEGLLLTDALEDDPFE